MARFTTVSAYVRSIRIESQMQFDIWTYFLRTYKKNRKIYTPSFKYLFRNNCLFVIWKLILEQYFERIFQCLTT